MTYRLQELPDGRWTVIVAATGEPVRLAGIPQVGLTRVEAEITLEILVPAAAAARARDEQSRAARPRAA